MTAVWSLINGRSFQNLYPLFSMTNFKGIKKLNKYVYFSQAIIYCPRAPKPYFKYRFQRAKSRGTCLNILNFHSIICFENKVCTLEVFHGNATSMIEIPLDWIQSEKNVLPCPFKCNRLFNKETGNDVEEGIKITM